MSKKHAGYVYICIKRETRALLTRHAGYKDTWDTIINRLMAAEGKKRVDDFAAQNIDHVDGDDEERGA